MITEIDGRNYGKILSKYLLPGKKEKALEEILFENKSNIGQTSSINALLVMSKI